jgi:acetyl esterase/lipase
MSTTVAKPPVTFAVRVRRVLLRWLAFGVGIYLALMIGMICSQRELLYSPRKVAALPAADVKQLGNDSHRRDDRVARRAAPARLAVFSSRTLLRTRAWLVLYFGGNAGCRADRVFDCCELTHHDCDVVLVDYRGYGDNAGTPTEADLRDDARRLHRAAVEQWHMPAERIVLFGESLGGAVATGLWPAIFRKRARRLRHWC